MHPIGFVNLSMRKYLLACFILFSCQERVDNEKEEVPTTSKEEVLLRTLKAHPDSLLARETLIQLYREEGNYDKALQQVKGAIAKDSTNDRLYFIKGTLQYENDDTSGAINSFEKAVNLAPIPTYQLHLATLYANTFDERALVIAGQLAHEKTVSDEKILFLKGLYYAAGKKYEQAISYMDQCLLLNFNFMEAYREKAIALYNQRKYEEALQVLNKAVTLQNSYDEGYYYIGKCLEKLNRYDEAIESYQRALLYNPDYSEAKEALAALAKKTAK